MKSKKINGFSNDLVYSTNPSAFQSQQKNDDSQGTLEPQEQKLKIVLDRKLRRGKTVTLIIGFEGGEEDLNNLGRRLKVKCGIGGSVKDGKIILQGDYREIISKWLTEWGYSLKK